MKFPEAFHKKIRSRRKRVAVFCLCFLFVCLSIPAIAQSIGNLLIQAQKQIETGEFENALALVEKALKEQPLNASAFFLQGLAFSGLERWEQAYESFAKAWSKNQSLLLAKRNQGISAFHLKRFVEAETALRIYVRSVSDDPVAYASLGRVVLTLGKVSEAVRLIKKAGPLLDQDDELKIDFAKALFQTGSSLQASAVLGRVRSDDATLHFQIGTLLTENGLHLEAARSFQKARASYPDHLIVTYNLALAYFRGRKYSETTSLLEELVKQNVQDGDVLGLLADAYHKTDRLREAYQTLQKAILVQPQNKRHFIQLLSICIDLEEYDAGFPVVEQALKQHPRAYELYMQRALLYCLRNQFSLAEVDCRRAIEMAPGNDGLKVGLATILMNGDRLLEAGKVLGTLKKESKDHFVLYLHADIVTRIGFPAGSPQEKEVVEMLQDSIKANPAFPPARLALARIYRDLADWNLAREQLEKAVQLEPNNRACNYELYRLYLKSGEKQKAAEVAKKIEQIGDIEKEDFFQRALVKQGLQQYSENTSVP
ncbi:MAG: tetratricopeptide repeat protein [Acidobacteria bacterium]|nr:tetratricopeptide repeat protein [Acidobacteriota bacterium]MCI0719759.1 tetratricopeptide repeat protein [Acidobacteriota bacterium]